MNEELDRLAEQALEDALNHIRLLKYLSEIRGNPTTSPKLLDKVGEDTVKASDVAFASYAALREKTDDNEHAIALMKDAASRIVGIELVDGLLV